MGELILRYGSQFGIGISELGPNCRNEIAIGFVEIGLTLKRGKGPDSPPPIPPAVPTLYAPDPVQKSESESRKREKGKRSEAECFLWRAVGSLGRFQPQAAVSISMLDQRERPRWQEVLLPTTAGKRVIEKRGRKVVVYCGNPSDR